MATVTKDFKVKAGLIVEGTNGTINGSDIITEDIITGGTQTNIAVTYNPGTKTLDFVAENGVADSTTDDLVEGSTNQYFTDARAKDSAANLLTGATLTNISITGTGAGLTITAENGVADSDTDDLVEGTTNLYYTNARARAAVSAGDGLDYNSTTGVFSADLGNGLQFDVNGQIEIDDTIVATDANVATAVSDHSDLTTGVHGVSGNVAGTSDIQELTNKTIGSGTTLSATIDANGFTITDLAAPVNASDAATKTYVDSVAQGLHVKEGVDAATTDTLATLSGGTVTYDNGTAGVGATLTLSVALTSLDGRTLADGDRVLVKNEVEPAYNGIYVRTSSTVFTRDPLFDSDEEIEGGDFVFVVEGTVNGSTGWVQSSTVNNVGVDDMVWIQFSGSGTYSAGNGLTLTGTEFAIDTTITATNTFVTDAVDDHSALTSGTHGVTGTLVGTSDTQTLTNKTLGSGTSLSANLDAANTAKIVNLVDPASAQDAATKKYVDDEITAVNSTIDNLTTTEIAEGTNLYFTDSRAVTALEAVVPNFVAVELNSVAKQVATTAGVFATLPTAVIAWNKSEYRSAELLVKVAYGTHTELSKVVLTLDTSDNIAITEYAVVGTNGSLSAISADISAGNVVVSVTPNVDAIATVVGTLLV